MTQVDSRSQAQRSVITRVLWSYGIVVLAFAIATGWSTLALRRAASEASLMRAGYYPLALSVRDLVAKQDTYNSQLNHITAARNPADLRVWFDFALRMGRPKMFGEVKAAIGRAFLSSGDENAQRVGRELLGEMSSIERFFAPDAEELARLFEALERGDEALAEQLRDDLVTRGSQGTARLGRLELRVEHEVELLSDQARARERLALRLLFAFSGTSLLVGLLMALYARRVLRPLRSMTERAKVVALGDLSPRPALASPDELGELSRSFESMIAAIARANEQLVANERLATVGKMAAHVTHEIRNPLSSIALNLELLEDEIGSDAGEKRALLRAIGGEVERLNSLSQQYLSLARQKRSSVSDEDLAQVLKDACEFVRRELQAGNVHLSLVIDGALESVQVDEGQVKQALFNLLRNAREAMPDGGAIQVGAKNVSGGVEVVIEDEGTGIDEATRSRLFEPFFTTKRHGTGLGLAITRQILESHGGSIEFASRSPRGTRVTLWLPSRRPQAVVLPGGAALGSARERG